MLCGNYFYEIVVLDKIQRTSQHTTFFWTKKICKMKSNIHDFLSRHQFDFVQLHVSLIPICFIFTLFRRSWTLHKKVTFFLKNFFIFAHWIWWEGFTFHQKPCYNYTRNLKLQRRIQNPAKYLKWNVFRKSLMTRSRELWKRSILDAWHCSEYVSKLGITVAGQE